MRYFLHTITLSLATLTITHSQIRSGFDSNVLAANDDSSTGLVPFGFEIDFFGRQFSEAFINNNGNISFDQSFRTFTPSVIDLANTAIIAPFFADVDTRGAGSGEVTYGQGTAFGDNAFAVNWVDVGFFSQRTDLLNSFQLVLVERPDIGSGAFDIEFNYGQIQWETGNASSGEDGLGGDSARVGYSNGTGDNFIELPGSAVNGALLDDGPNALVELTNVNDPGRFVFFVRDGLVVETVPVTEVEVATLRDAVISLSSLGTGDINNRLLRYRTGVGVTKGEYDLGLNGDNFSLDFFGSYRFHSRETDQRTLPNANGLIASVAPETRLTASTGTVGAESKVNDSFRLGLAGVYSSGEVEHLDGSYDLDIDSLGLAVYSSFYFSDLVGKTDLYFDALYSFNYGELNTARELSARYQLNAVSGEGNFTSQELSFNTGVIFESGALRHGPFAEYVARSSDSDGFTEQGLVDSIIPSISSDSRKASVGYQASLVLNGSPWSPHARFAYEREFENDPVVIDSLLLPALPEESYIFGAGLIYDPGLGMFASLDAEYREFDAGVKSWNVSLTFNIDL